MTTRIAIITVTTIAIIKARAIHTAVANMPIITTGHLPPLPKNELEMESVTNIMVRAAPD